MAYDMNLRLREMMALRLDDAVGDAQKRVSTNPMTQLVRVLCESCLWLIRDWPNQKIDNHESVRASRLDTLGRLRQLLRVRPPKNSELDGLILLLSDAILTISEQWEGSEPEASSIPAAVASPAQQQQQPRSQNSLTTTLPSAAASTVRAAQSNGPSQLLAPPGNACKPSPPKQPRLIAATVDDQQPSTSYSNSIPQTPQKHAWIQQREISQANISGSPSVLWSFFTKVTGETGMHLAQCIVCRRMIPRHNHGTSSMKNHLKNYHTAEYITLGLENSTSSENSQTSPSGMWSEAERLRMTTPAKRNAPVQVSAIVAALNRNPATTSGMRSLDFSGDSVKEEELDYDEAPNQMAAENEDNVEEPSGSQAPPPVSQPSTWRVNRGGSDIWSYFRKEDIGGEKHGCCTLCEWSRKIYNHGTNTMWIHLKRAHPYEYSVLKPFEHHSHGQHVHVFKEGQAVPSHLTLPCRPERQGSLEMEEEDGQE